MKILNDPDFSQRTGRSNLWIDKIWCRKLKLFVRTYFLADSCSIFIRDSIVHKTHLLN